MNTISEITHTSGATGKVTKYKFLNGLYFDIETSDEMCRILEKLYQSKERVRFHWGDAKTGRDWEDIYNVAGTVGRSCGVIKVPLLINNARSSGGGAILTHCIVKIVTSKGKRVIYQHPKYHVASVAA